jgi:hypothetical protein
LWQDGVGLADEERVFTEVQMTTETRETGIVERDGVLIGARRTPRNGAADQKGSIHDDATAKPLGFRGGTVAGSIHMEQFPPLLVRAFGERWFETGSLSTYFRNATTDAEPVQAFVSVPAPGGDAQTDVWMHDDAGTLVLEGTASIGSPSESSMLRKKLAEPRTAGELRILDHLQVGFETPDATPTRLTTRAAKPRLRVITEPMPWYDGASPWGGSIANPGLVVHMMVAVQPALDLTRHRAVGLYGAIEVQHTAGPVFAEHDYEVTAKILAVGDTPKSEYLWFESTMREPAGRDVASMIMMLRFMKASSRVWAER